MGTVILAIIKIEIQVIPPDKRTISKNGKVELSLNK
jgi:hypothetical protein